MENPQNIADFVNAAHRVAERGLVTCGSGNLSLRAGNGRMLVSTTRSWLGALTGDQVAVCRIEDGASLNGRKPSSEIGFHSGILRERPDVNVVLHFQSPAATAVACMEPRVDQFYVIPEIPYYIGPVAEVPFLMPGSAEFAKAVVEAMRTHDLALLRNHGQVTVGRTLDETIEKAAYFELACEIMHQCGTSIRFIPAAAAEELRRMRLAGLGKPGP